jgi:hypothetical protein
MTPEEALKLKPGDQIAYVPEHAGGNLNHPDCEFGFVTSVREHEAGNVDIYCRYWSKYTPDKLRTLANSEAANARHIVLHHSKSQYLVQEMLEQVQRNQKRMRDMFESHGGVPKVV